MITFFEKQNKLSWFITIIGAILIFYISSLSFAPSAAGGTNFLAILYHILAFFSFSFFLFISLVRGQKKYMLFSIVILISFMYGLTDEIHQYFVPGRACAFFDVFLDSVGIAFASLIYLIRLKF